MTWRVWSREWVAVYTSDADGPDGVEECFMHFEKTYRDRVPETEYQVRDYDEWPATLLLDVPIVVGEFRRKEDAKLYFDQFAADGWLTELGSPEDKRLEEYGKKKLAT